MLGIAVAGTGEFNKEETSFSIKKWDFSQEKSHFWGIGSPSWTNFELLRADIVSAMKLLSAFSV
jgi:hypothetical protein